MYLLILLHMFKYSLMHGYVNLSCYFVFTTTLMSFIDRHILMLTIATYIKL